MLGSFLSFVLLAVAASPAKSQPTAAQFAALNATVGGRLAVGKPWSLPCFTANSTTRNSAACSTVSSNYANHLFRTENFGAYEIPQWETCQTTGDECLLDYTSPGNPSAFSAPEICSQGSVPGYYINVTGPNDIQAAYTFSLNTKMPLVIKNTGHDFIGRSSGPGTLALWTHNLQSLSLNKSFKPDGAPPSAKAQTAITIGAGQRFQTIFDFAKANGVTFLGGADPSVGASGGWVQGGGHSALSVTQGLGVDRVLQFRIITPDGALRAVNQYTNTDLWFALRGGGGGTFGVVLETTFLVTPLAPVQVLLGTWPAGRNTSITTIKALSGNAVQFAKDGWGGYITAPANSAVWANPILSDTAAQASGAKAKAIFESVGGTATFYTMPSFTDFFNTFIGPNADPVGRPQVLATRLIQDTAFTDNTLLDSMIAAVVDSDFGQILSIGPYSFKGYDNNTAINPAWRTTVWHSLMSYNWNYDSTLADRVNAYKKLETQWATVRARTPNSGAYFNEADVNEPNWQTSFWGPNYSKLLAIKNKYDPNHILDCWKCVGWKGASDSRYKCYPSIN